MLDEGTLNQLKGREEPKILMHADRQGRIHFNRRADQVSKNNVVCKFSRATAGLHDYWAVRLVGGLHDGQHLLHVAYVEGGQAVAILSSMIEQLAQGDQRITDTRWWCDVGCSFRIRAMPVDAVPPACSTTNAIGLASYIRRNLPL